MSGNTKQTQSHYWHQYSYSGLHLPSFWISTEILYGHCSFVLSFFVLLLLLKPGLFLFGKKKVFFHLQAKPLGNGPIISTVDIAFYLWMYMIHFPLCKFTICGFLYHHCVLKNWLLHISRTINYCGKASFFTYQVFFQLE